MLDKETRQAVLVLKAQGFSLRRIARELRISRRSVVTVLQEGTAEIPPMAPKGALEPHLERVRTEVVACKGNLVRVREELAQDGIEVKYSTLARFVARHRLRKPPKAPSGRYEFGPGKEMQFDTSPHDVKFRQAKRRCQCASLIFGHSRMLFVQYYPRFTRFECKVFLTDALRFFGGACQRCIIDNTNVVVTAGTGPDAVAAPEMEAFEERFGFRFVAHRILDKNRSGKVERPFHYVENNFLVKRTFEDFADLNRQVLEFCRRNNESYKRDLHARPIDLFAAEQPFLVPLPAYVPEVYRVHHRTVDLEGYVNLHANHYSVPYRLIGKEMEVRETPTEVHILLGPREVAVHAKAEPNLRQFTTIKEHRPKRGEKNRQDSAPIPEEVRLRALGGDVASFVDSLKRRRAGRAILPIRRLHRLSVDYPAEAFLEILRTATQYGLYDLNRIERMILRLLAGRCFDHLAIQDEDDQGGER